MVPSSVPKAMVDTGTPGVEAPGPPRRPGGPTVVSPSDMTTSWLGGRSSPASSAASAWSDWAI